MPTISKKLSLWIAGSVAFLAIICLFLLNGFLEGIVKEYLGRELVRLNESKKYNLIISDIRLNIFRGNLSLVEMSALPTKEYAKLFEDGATEELALKELLVSQADIKGTLAELIAVPFRPFQDAPDQARRDRSDRPKPGRAPCRRGRKATET